MKKAIGMLVMLMGLTANAQTTPQLKMNSLVETYDDCTLTIEFDNILYAIDTVNNYLTLFDISKDKRSGSLTRRYKLNQERVGRRSTFKNQKKL